LVRCETESTTAEARLSFGASGKLSILNKFLLNRYYTAVVLLILTFTFAPVQAEPLRLTIKARSGLQYDIFRFETKPNAFVEINLVNEDDMAHNLVITKPGQRLKVANAALRLGVEGDAKNWVPDLDSVLFFTPVLKPGSSHLLKFKAPEASGVYPYVCTFPGHGLLMYGAMYVGMPLPDLAKDMNLPELARRGNLTQKQLHAWGDKRPLMYRIFMPNASPAAVAVALRHGQNYCWDAAQCRLRYVWYGAFVDPWPVWRGNGNGLAKVLGTKYWEAGSAGAVQIGDKDSIANFLGYKKIDGQPEFHYRVNNVDVYELITPLHSVIGIQRSFRIPNNKQLVSLPVGSVSQVIFKHSAGKLKEGMLILNAAEAAEFTVSIGLKQ
jgi:azurin